MVSLWSTLSLTFLSGFQPPAKDLSHELQKLAGNVRDVQSNLDGIAKMTVSPRKEKNDAKKLDKNMGALCDDDDDENERTPKNRSVFASITDITPPVKDPGKLFWWDRAILPLNP